MMDEKIKSMLEKAGLKEEEKILVENILTTHNIKLKEVEEIES